MNKKTHRILSSVLALVLTFSLIACEEEEAVVTTSGWAASSSSEQTQGAAPFASATPKPPTHELTGQRDYRVKPKGNGEDVITVMLYLCGSDLESEGAAATLDLEEIMEANISDNLNIIVETGGATEWANDFVDPDTNERWRLTSGGPEFLADVGKRDMARGSTLTDFIKYSAKEFPADRYMLILWDHGGGTVDGFGYDERFDTESMMPISELNKALDNAGVVFDMIGFDCCLMSTAETAFMVEKYADFMIASQRVEPGEGWNYTPWVNALSKNTSMSTVELGMAIVDSFMEGSRYGYYKNELTLAVTDLTYIPDLFKSLYNFFEKAEDSLTEDKLFISTSQTLGGSRAISDNYDLVDLTLLIKSMEGSDEVLSRLEQCIVYSATTISDHNGLCLYFPYTDLSKVGDALDIYEEIGIDDTYQSFITTFANLMVGGQVYSGGGTDNPLGGAGYDLDYWLSLDWVDELLIEENAGFYEDNTYDSTEFVIDEKGDNYVLNLSDDDWDLITSIEQRVFYDDGEGYLDLGSDAMYEFDDDGDLIIGFDNTWVALDGELVCYITSEEVFEGDEWYTYGVVPVLYDGKDAEILLMWDDENPEGFAAGWRYIGTGSSSQKGLFEFEDGMIFELLFDYYTYDGDYDDQYIWGEIIIDGELIVSYEDIGEADCMVYYELYDIYRNTYWTESIIYSLE